jgi:hypothetical protein
MTQTLNKFKIQIFQIPMPLTPWPPLPGERGRDLKNSVFEIRNLISN